MESDLRVSISVIDVGVPLLLEALGVDLTQTALGFRPHANLAGQQHRGPAHSALYAGRLGQRLAERRRALELLFYPLIGSLVTKISEARDGVLGQDAAPFRCNYTEHAVTLRLPR
jgi:hypothetical protein